MSHILCLPVPGENEVIDLYLLPQVRVSVASIPSRFYVHYPDRSKGQYQSVPSCSLLICLLAFVQHACSTCRHSRTHVSAAPPYMKVGLCHYMSVTTSLLLFCSFSFLQINYRSSIKSVSITSYSARVSKNYQRNHVGYRPRSPVSSSGAGTRTTRLRLLLCTSHSNDGPTTSTTPFASSRRQDGQQTITDFNKWDWLSCH